MVKALEAEGWSIGTDGRVARTIERGSATIEQVNASSPLARVALNGKTRWVSVRDLVAFAAPWDAAREHDSHEHRRQSPPTRRSRIWSYRPRTGKQAEAQADRAKKAQQRAENAGREGRGSGQEGAGGRPEGCGRSRLSRAGSTVGQAHRGSETGCLSHPTNKGALPR